MREIEFRGKDIGTGKWITGHGYAKHDFSHYVFNDEMNASVLLPKGLTMVFAETVGQYTGLKDVNGVKIFEGDIVLWRYTESSGLLVEYKEVVCFEDGCCISRAIDGFYPSGLNPNGTSLYKRCALFDEAASEYPQRGFFYGVIGNIHDTPELFGQRSGK
jgi:uncharacterized phage protein (TIGR01671 family)